MVDWQTAATCDPGVLRKQRDRVLFQAASVDVGLLRTWLRGKSPAYGGPMRMHARMVQGRTACSVVTKMSHASSFRAPEVRSLVRVGSGSRRQRRRGSRRQQGLGGSLSQAGCRVIFIWGPSIQIWRALRDLRSLALSTSNYIAVEALRVLRQSTPCQSRLTFAGRGQPRSRVGQCG